MATAAVIQYNPMLARVGCVKCDSAFSCTAGDTGTPLALACGHSCCRGCVIRLASEVARSSARAPASSQAAVLAFRCPRRCPEVNCFLPLELASNGMASDLTSVNFSLVSALETARVVQTPRARRAIPPSSVMTTSAPMLSPRSAHYGTDSPRRLEEYAYARLCARAPLCDVCKDPFSHRRTDATAPVLLSCGHSFCALCISRLATSTLKSRRREVDGTSVVRCPMRCSAVTVINDIELWPRSTASPYGPPAAGRLNDALISVLHAARVTAMTQSKTRQPSPVAAARVLLKTDKCNDAATDQARPEVAPTQCRITAVGIDDDEEQGRLELTVSPLAGQRTSGRPTTPSAFDPGLRSPAGRVASPTNERLQAQAEYRRVWNELVNLQATRHEVRSPASTAMTDASTDEEDLADAWSTSWSACGAGAICVAGAVLTTCLALGVIFGSTISRELSSANPGWCVSLPAACLADNCTTACSSNVVKLYGLGRGRLAWRSPVDDSAGPVVTDFPDVPTSTLAIVNAFDAMAALTLSIPSMALLLLLLVAGNACANALCASAWNMKYMWAGARSVFAVITVMLTGSCAAAHGLLGTHSHDICDPLCQQAALVPGPSKYSKGSVCFSTIDERYYNHAGAACSAVADGRFRMQYDFSILWMFVGSCWVVVYLSLFGLKGPACAARCCRASPGSELPMSPGYGMPLNANGRMANAAGSVNTPGSSLSSPATAANHPVNTGVAGANV